MWPLEFLHVIGAENKDITGQPGVECALDGNVVRLSSKLPVTAVVLRFRYKAREHALVLGDAWERSYGDLQWKPVDPQRDLPWYGAVTSPHEQLFFGVKTGAHSLAKWSVGTDFLELHLDVRSGTRPVHLGSRHLNLAEIVIQPATGNLTPYQMVTQGCKALSKGARKVKAPVYGINDWYYANGKNNRANLLADAERAAEWTHGLKNRPFSVIDDGWQPNRQTQGPWDKGNADYGDMATLAQEFKKMGCRPGLWIRPLHTLAELPAHWYLKKHILDPSRAEVLEHIKTDIARIHGWGYELIKHDFSTWDVGGWWGFQMEGGVFKPGPSFADDTRTSAEIMLDFYHAIRSAAGDAYLLGCNAIGHLIVGTHELQRIGDDTSGEEWARTRKMGVNTLAFRSPQHGHFFQADPDCAGVTTKVPWDHAQRWLKLVSQSGLPLFVSAQKEALGPEQVAALKEAFRHASEHQPTAEPLDWTESLTPQKWKLGGQVENFDWSD